METTEYDLWKEFYGYDIKHKGLDTNKNAKRLKVVHHFCKVY